MKTEILYATHCEITVVDALGWHWTLSGESYTALKDALAVAETILNGNSVWETEQIDCIFITSTETGEILAECKPDSEPESDSDWNDDCDYETGYDPYLGCFTWDE